MKQRKRVASLEDFLDDEGDDLGSLRASVATLTIALVGLQAEALAAVKKRLEVLEAKVADAKKPPKRT